MTLTFGKVKVGSLHLMTISTSVGICNINEPAKIFDE